MTSINDSTAVRRVLDLIAIPGKSCCEKQVAEYLTQALIDAGVPKSSIREDSAHKKSPAGGDVGNLIVRLKGTIRGAAPRLLMAHMDTVPPAVGCRPIRQGDIIRPASATTALGGDNRAGCAVVLTAVSEILEKGIPHPPLTLLFTVQEEIGLRGARFVDVGRLGKCEACFNWDGSDPTRLINAAVGATNLEIRIGGIASHAGAHPEDGVNALTVASLAVADLHAHGWHGLVVRGRNRGASNVGAVHGGEATNVVMPEVSLQAEARSHQPNFRRRIVKEFRKAFERAVRSVRNAEGKTGTLSFEEDTRYEAFGIPESSECIQIAKRAIEACGLSATVTGCDGGLDANWMTLHGFPTVTLGCGQRRIHTVDETLDIPEFLTACRIATGIAAGE